MYFEKNQNLINNDKNKIEIIYLNTLAQENNILRTNEFRKISARCKYLLDDEADGKEENNIKEITICTVDEYRGIYYDKINFIR